MAFDKVALKAAILATFNQTKEFDGSPGETGDDAITLIASELADAIETAVTDAIDTTVGTAVSSAIDAAITAHETTHHIL